MALKIKATTIRIPNLDLDPDVTDREEAIEDVFKARINGGYEFIATVGGDNFAVLIFKKTE